MSMLSPTPAAWRLCLALALGAGCVSHVSAQERAVAPGERVRLTLRCAVASRPLPVQGTACGAEGTVVRFTPDALELTADGIRTRHPLDSIAGVEVRRVVGPGWKVPTAAGFLLGGAGTYALLHAGGSTSLCDRSRNQDAMGRRECAGLTVLGGAVGAGIGALTAALLRTERWIVVPPGRLGLSIPR